MRELRRRARASAADVAAAVRLVLLRCSARRAGIALMYHRVAPDAGDPAREFVPALAVSQFDAQLAHLRRHYRPVPARHLQAAAVARRRGGRFPVAVTLDDDTTTHVEHAAPCLRRHGVVATFFLNGHALEGPAAYWWEVLQAAVDAGATWERLLPDAVYRRACDVQGGREPGPYGVSVAVEELSPADRQALTAEIAATLGDAAPAAGLSPREVRALVTGGQEVGFHGHHHEPMSLLAPAELSAELDGGRERLAAAAGAPLATIAYPHGRTNATVADAARERGFRAGFTVEAKAVTSADDPLLLGRLDGATPDLGVFRRSLVRALAEAR